MKSGMRSLEELKPEILRRAGHTNPFEWVKREDVEEVVSWLESTEDDHWAEVWGRMGQRYEALGERQENAGEPCGDAFYLAYDYYRIGRYPVASTPGKKACYEASRRNFLKAARHMDPPVERVDIPFEGKSVICYLQIPRGAHRPPVVLHWGGVDGWKEDRRRPSQAFHRRGLATMTLDMPGVGESPVPGSDPEAERTFSTALDYLETRADVDGSRLGVMGASFGGYWAAKVAHVEAKRLKGAVDWGGGVHLTFQEEWLRPALTTRAEQYLMGPASLLDARGYIFRTRNLDEILERAPRLSLVTQGLIDQPCAPLLLINGKRDDQHPIDDFHLLVEHGDPKDVYIFPDGGHMGRVPGKSNEPALDVVVRWLHRKLTG